MRRRHPSDRSSLLSFGCLAILALVAGCADGTAPPQRAPVVILPQAYRFGPCTPTWSPARPPTERTVVDFHFGSDGDGPTMEQTAAVVGAGGVVIHQFHVPILRAEIDVDAVSSLVGPPPRGVAYYAATVPDPDRRELVVLVMLSHDLTAADIAAVEALGGRVLSRWEHVEGYAVEIHDVQIPRVRSLPGVKSVSKNSLFCLLD